MSIDNELANLEASMTRDYAAVNGKKNPCHAAYADYDYGQKMHVMGQYSLFSRHIIHFLTEVLYQASSAASHAGIAAEMKNNLAEELGIDNVRHLPHYMLLCDGSDAF